MLAFFAVECGWPIEYVLDNLTLYQCERLLQEIQKMKTIELRKSTECFLMASARAQGTISKSTWDKFISSFSGLKRKTVDETFKGLKMAGIKVEEN